MKAVFTINQLLGIDQYFIVNFRVKINASLPGSTRIQNQANVSGLNLEYDPMWISSSNRRMKIRVSVTPSGWT